jgi:hypothetical protein
MPGKIELGKKEMAIYNIAKNKIGKGKNLEAVKKFAKDNAVKLGISSGAIISAIIAYSLKNKDNEEAFVFNSLSDLSDEELKRLMGGKGERIDKAKATLKKYAVPIAGLSIAVVLFLATIVGKDMTDKSDRKKLADFLNQSSTKFPRQTLKIMFSNIDRDKFMDEHPDASSKIGMSGGSHRDKSVKILRDAYPDLDEECACCVLDEIEKRGGTKQMGKGVLADIMKVIKDQFNFQKKIFVAVVEKGGTVLINVIKRFGVEKSIRFVAAMLKDSQYKEYHPLLEKIADTLKQAKDAKKELEESEKKKTKKAKPKKTKKVKAKPKTKVLAKTIKVPVAKKKALAKTKKAKKPKKKGKPVQVGGEDKERPERKVVGTWNSFVTEFAKQNNISLSEAMKKASPVYREMKNKK